MTGTNSLTKAIIQYCNLNGWRVWRNNNGAVYSVKQKAFRRNPNHPKGISDIIGFNNKTGRFIGIEIKGTPKDKLSPAQTLFLRSLHEAGGIAICARTFDQFQTDFHHLTGQKKPKQFSNGLKMRDPSAINMK